MDLTHPDVTVIAEVLGPTTAIGIMRKAWRERGEPAPSLPAPREVPLHTRTPTYRSEDHMDLNLTDREAKLLRELLEDYLPTLRREVARTEKMELRHELVERQDLVERLVGRLASSV